MQIFTHPDNLPALKKQLESIEHDPNSLLSWFTIRGNANLERDKPTGRFILPGGRIVERCEVLIEERFVSYGPEDVDWLLMAGLIREQREMVVIIMNANWQLRASNFPMFTPPRHLLCSSFV